MFCKFVALVLFVCGIMGVIAGIAGLIRGTSNNTPAFPSTDFPLPNQNLVERILMLISGVYSLLLIPPILFWHTICSFNKEDKTTDAMLEPREWPQWITKPLTVLNHPFFNCAFCIVMAIPLFTSIYTSTSGAFLLMAALVYFIAGCKSEKIPRITGIRVVQG